MTAGASCDMRRVERASLVLDPGDYYLAGGHEAASPYLCVMLPSRERLVLALDHQPGVHQSAAQPPRGFWGWNADRDRPTLWPSILTERWHGHVRGGRLIDVLDQP